MDRDNRKWRLEKIKSVRVSPELLEMLNDEVAARNTTLSQYIRQAMVLQMKYANHPRQQDAA